MNNKKILITGSLGLIGFEVALLFLKKGFNVIGIDNDLRGKIFDIKTNYYQKLFLLEKKFPYFYRHYNLDIRNSNKIQNIFNKYQNEIHCIIHTAAQTSHDWAVKDPFLDFSVNAVGTLNLLESYRLHSSKAVFIYTSTNKVYGDSVNKLYYQELKTRCDLPVKDDNYYGINEHFSIDNSIHSLFGVSKASADLLVQEYGRYFNLKTGVFRLGVVAGCGQNGSSYQGFLKYMIDEIKNKNIFTIIGYKGKQVRDIIHAKDVAKAFYLYFKKPKKGEVYNLGGGRGNSASVLELIKRIEKLFNKKPKIKYLNKPRQGDHRWWISDCKKFKKSYPSWNIEFTIDDIILDIYKRKL